MVSTLRYFFSLSLNIFVSRFSQLFFLLQARRSLIESIKKSATKFNSQGIANTIHGVDTFAQHITFMNYHYLFMSIIISFTTLTSFHVFSS